MSIIQESRKYGGITFNILLLLRPRTRTYLFQKKSLTRKLLCTLNIVIKIIAFFSCLLNDFARLFYFIFAS